MDANPPSGPREFVLEGEGLGAEFVSLFRRSLQIWRLGIRVFWRTWLFLGIATGLIEAFVGPALVGLGNWLFGTYMGYNLGTLADVTPALLFAVAVLVFTTGAMTADLTPWVITHGRARPGRSVALEVALSNWEGLLGGAVATAGSLVPLLLLEGLLSALSYTAGSLVAILWVFGALLAVVAVATLAFAVSVSLYPVVLADQGGTLRVALRSSRFLTTSIRVQLFALDFVPLVLLLGLYIFGARTASTVVWVASAILLGVLTGLVGPWLAANRISLYLAYPEADRRPFAEKDS